MSPCCSHGLIQSDFWLIDPRVLKARQPNLSGKLTVDILAKNVMLTSPIWDKLYCWVSWTLKWNHLSSMETYCFFNIGVGGSLRLPLGGIQFGWSSPLTDTFHLCLHYFLFSDFHFIVSWLWKSTSYTWQTNWHHYFIKSFQRQFCTSGFLSCKPWWRWETQMEGLEKVSWVCFWSCTHPAKTSVSIFDSWL